jgi:methyltransferase-like protein/ubiquinone/menaquinone biosynthesis C-methylase UbiE
MSTGTHTEYDAVVYPSGLYPQTHPDRLATIATLFGLNPAPVEKCRVLEIACGDGTNLLTMAFSLPESRFLGIDLAADPIRRGNQLIEKLGLKNVALRQMDVLAAPGDLGVFDYIIAHGVYSWVPAEVREKIMAICARHLSEQGVAYISYNAYPGNHLRDAVRRMMRFHADRFEAPAEKVRQARALVKFAAEAKAKPGLWQNILKQQLERIAQYTEEAFYHDDLSGINQPFYFIDLMEHAARHGLQYLAEADLPEMLADGFEEPATTALSQLADGAFLAREQYLDFLKGRAFRQTLLCRDGLKFTRSLLPECAVNLLVAGETRPANAGLDVSTSEPADFKGPRNAQIATGNPVAKAALVHLGTIFPSSIRFADLLHLARQRAGRNSPGDDPRTERDKMELAEFLVRAHAIGFLELHSFQPAFVTQISDRPAASRLARLQIQSGHRVSTLLHRTMRLDDPLGRHLLGLLDGTRDMAALVTALAEAVNSGAASIPGMETGAVKTEDVPKVLLEQLRPNLQSLANSAVLVA